MNSIQKVTFAIEFSKNLYQEININQISESQIFMVWGKGKWLQKRGVRDVSLREER
jgi:hypothetical protein